MEPDIRRDRGFTLVEVLIAMSLTGVIIGALATAMSISFRFDNANMARLQAANSSLSATDAWPQDIAATPISGRSADQGVPSCQSDEPGTVKVIDLTRVEDVNGTPTWHRVAYRVGNDARGRGQLHRATCTSTTGPTSGFGAASSNVLARNLDPLPNTARLVGGLGDPTLGLQLDAPGSDPDFPEQMVIEGVAPPPGGTLPPVEAATQPTRVSVTVTAPSTFATLAPLDISAVVRNSGTTPVTGLVLTDPGAAGPISCAPVDLAPGAEATCTYRHAVTQTDLNNGEDTIAASVTAIGPAGPFTTAGNVVVVPAIQAPQMTMVKQALTPTYIVPGDTVRFRTTITNNGNVTLSALSVDDPMMDGPAIACSPAPLAPAASVACEYTYIVQPGDLSGPRTSFATATANSPAGGVTAESNTTTVLPGGMTVATVQTPLVVVRITASASPYEGIRTGDSLTFTFQVEVAVGGSPLVNASLALDPPFASTCSVLGTLLPGTTTPCTVIRPASLGLTISAQLTVAGLPVGPLATVTVASPGPYRAMAVNLAAAPANLFTTLGQPIAYTATVTNIGTQALTGLVVNDRSGPMNCPSPNLAVGAQTTCTSTYTTTGPDAGGAVTNRVTATAAGGATAQSQQVTTTSAVGCAVQSLTPSPPSVGRDGAGTLDADVSLTVVGTGRCNNLRLRYYPRGASTVGVIANPDTPGGLTFTIPSDDGTAWNTGPALVDVLPAAPSVTPVAVGLTAFAVT